MIQIVCVVLLAFSASFVPLGEGRLAFDIGQPISTPAWQCLSHNGYTFGIIPILLNNGQPDPNAVNNIKAAQAAGVQRVDGLVNPCPKCGNPQGQLQAALNNLKHAGVAVFQIWINVEGANLWDPGNKLNNVNFLHGLVNEAAAQHALAGIYTNKGQWEAITGNNLDFKGLNLWHDHHNGQENFNGFSSFGGWTKPTMKQINALPVNVCNVAINQDYYV